MSLRKLCFLWVSLLGVALSVQGQGAGSACGGGRYLNDVFAGVPLKTADVVFGQNTSRNYASGALTPVTLMLDVYEPAGDVAARRPLIVLAFGGAFIQGSRQDADIVATCQAFARKGYVTAAIDYRLIEPDLANQYAVLSDQSLLADEVIRAAADMKAAVRFFRHDAATANAYRVDPAKIFVGGFSAGAITALQVAYTDDVAENPLVTQAYLANGGLEGNTDLPAPGGLLGTYTAAGLAGVFNIAGGVNRLSIVSAGNPPLFSAQGTADAVVPYDCGTIAPTTFRLCGSHQLAGRADTVGVLNYLHPVVGGGHGSPADEPDRSQIMAEAAAFLQPLVCGAALPVTLTAFAGHPHAADCTATLTWQTTAEHHSRAYEVQAAPDGHAWVPIGTVPSQNQPAGAAYTFRTGPLAGPQYFRLRLLDADGSFAYGPVVALAAPCAAALQIAPNPVRNSLIISNLPANPVQLFLYTATGQCVAQTRAVGQATFDLSAWPPGIYLLRAVGADGEPSQSVRVVKE